MENPIKSFWNFMVNHTVDLVYGSCGTSLYGNELLLDYVIGGFLAWFMLFLCLALGCAAIAGIVFLLVLIWNIHWLLIVIPAAIILVIVAGCLLQYTFDERND